MSQKFKVYNGGDRWFICVNEFSYNDWINRKGEVATYSGYDKFAFRNEDEAKSVLDAYLEKQKESTMDFYKIEGNPGQFYVKIGKEYLKDDGGLRLTPYPFQEQAAIFLALSKFCEQNKLIDNVELYNRVGKQPGWPVVFEYSGQNFTLDTISVDETKKRVIYKLKPLHLDG